jgi:hypothetical protein
VRVGSIAPDGCFWLRQFFQRRFNPLVSAAKSSVAAYTQHTHLFQLTSSPQRAHRQLNHLSTIKF